MTVFPRLTLALSLHHNLSSFSLEIRGLGALLNPVSNLSEPTLASRNTLKEKQIALSSHYWK